MEGPSPIRSRAAELRRAGWLEQAGRGLSDAGRPCNTWRVIAMTGHLTYQRRTNLTGTVEYRVFHDWTPIGWACKTTCAGATGTGSRTTASTSPWRHSPQVAETLSSRTVTR